jgi:predicted GH43/DUF377 family glycosyl hydrolase
MGHTLRSPLPLRAVKKEIPHSLERIVLKLMAKNPGDRFQSAAELSEALEAYRVNDSEKIYSLTSGITLRPETNQKALINRERELKAIRNHLDRLFLKKGGIVLLLGEQGVGKSRLIQEVETMVNVQMMEFYRVGCEKGIFSLGKMVWTIIRSLGKEQFAPEFIRDVQTCETQHTPSIQSGTANTALLMKVWETLIVHLSHELPTILIFEDLHHADDATLRVLQSSANILADRSVLLIGTVGEDEINKNSMLKELTNDSSITTKIELKPLSLDESGAFIKEYFSLDQDTAEHLSLKFRDKCKGNPLLLQDKVGQYFQRKAQRKRIAKKLFTVSMATCAGIGLFLLIIYFLPEDVALRRWILRTQEKNPFPRTSVWLEWKEVQENPVFIPSTKTFSSPSIILDKGTYKMWYVENGEVFYSESPDGISWDKSSFHKSSVLTANKGTTSFDTEGILTTAVIKEEKNYKMWYSGFQHDKIPRIGYALSSDGVHWVKIPGAAYKGAVLDIGEPNAIDEAGVSKPTISKVGNEYYMWYEGKYLAQYPYQNTICLAKSLDGILWKKHSNNPVFSATVKIDIFDSRIVGSPSVIYDGKMFRMWYFGSGYGINIGYAVSQDGITWFRMRHLIFLGALFGSGQKGVSELGRSQPVVNSVNGEYKMWFVGTNTEGMQTLEYATSSPLEIPTDTLPKPARILVNENFDDTTTLSRWNISGEKSERRNLNLDSTESVSTPNSLRFFNQEENDNAILVCDKLFPEQKEEFIWEFDIRLSSEKISGQWLLGYTDTRGVFRPAIDFFIASEELWSNYLNADPTVRSLMKGSFTYGHFVFEKEKWYTIKTRVNVSQGRLVMWVNGILLERSLELGSFSFSNVKTMNTLRYTTVEGGKTYWIDNVRVSGTQNEKNR